MLRICALNILHGGGTRIQPLSQYLQQTRAQILVLSEYRNSLKGQELKKKLSSCGYLYQYEYPQNSFTNSVLIASKLEGEQIDHLKADQHFPYGLLEVKFGAFRLFGVYFPHKKKHQFFPYLQLNLLQNDLPAIIIGDFNSGINGVDQKGTSFWYEDDMKRFEQINYRDAFRFAHGTAEAYSWYSHHGNGYRYDHCYVHLDLLPIVTHCDYDHSVREKKWSDHAAMILTLG